jgi:hypothetical protein
MVAEAELGYFYPLLAGQWGQPYPGNPVTRAQLQNAALQASILCTTAPGFVPHCYIRPGGGNLPIIGWTAQKNTGPAFGPYDPNTGHIPDWTGDPNSISAGRWDQTPLWSGWPVNPLNRAPIGVSPHQGTEYEPQRPTTDVGGSLPGFNEW